MQGKYRCGKIDIQEKIKNTTRIKRHIKKEEVCQ